MELKEFVKQALVDISTGVTEAQEALKETGAIINPSIVADDMYIDKTRGRRLVNSVRFNIGVTTEDKDGVKTGLGVLTGLLSIGASTASEGINRSISSIEFTVPIALPCNDDLKIHKRTMSSQTF